LRKEIKRDLERDSIKALKAKAKKGKKGKKKVSADIEFELVVKPESKELKESSELKESEESNEPREEAKVIE
jgi:hypothetical protein